MLQKGVLLSIFRMFRVDTNHLKPKGPSLDFYWHCETLFFFNLFEELFYSQYFMILC